MVTMTTEQLGIARGRPFTRADLETMPDDGRRYELVDGLLIVSPAPRHLHQRAIGNLYLLLRAACPIGLEVILAPFDVALSDDTVMQPDLLVARDEEFTPRDLPTAPLLAVEVLSPSTRAYDLLLKKDSLQRAGCRHYWVVDPDVPAITTWSLVGGAYAETATATGDDVLTVTEPYEITIVPSALVAH